MRRALVVAASLAGLLGAGLGALAWFGPSYGSRWIERRLQAETGLRWRVAGEPGLTLRPRPTLVARNALARMESPDGAVAEIRVETVRIPGALASALRGAAPSAIELDGLVLTLPAELRDLPRAVGSIDKGRTARGAADVPERVTIRNGSVRLAADIGRTDTIATDISVDLAREGQGGRALVQVGEIARGEVKLSGLSFAREPVRVEATISSPHLATGTLSISGEVAAEQGSVTVSRLEGDLGGDPFRGAFAATLGDRPNLRLDLGFRRLRLPQDSKPSKIGWSIKPADLAALRLFNGRIVFRAESVEAAPLTLREVGLDARVADGALTATLTNATLYEGRASGTLHLGQDGAKLDGQVRNVRGLPFLSEAFGLRLVDGTASVRAVLQGQVLTPADLSRTLSGVAEIEVRDGVLNTIDLPNILRRAADRLMSRAEGGAGGSTAFESLSAHFDVRDGRAVTKDIALTGPLIAATGEGVVDLVAERVAFRIDPQLIGLAGVTDLAKLRLPVVVEGPWNAPRAYLDLNEMATRARQETRPGGLGELIGGGIGALLDAFGARQDGDKPDQPRR